MLKMLNNESSYAEMETFAPGIIGEMLNQADIQDDVILGESEPWDFPETEDDPE
jgi:hypothetical protein